MDFVLPCLSPRPFLRYIYPFYSAYQSEVMRLLNSLTREPTLFLSDDEIPPYAILSHTWEDEEVSLQDISHQEAKLKKGYNKIKYACDQALGDNIAWIWIDT